VWPELVNDGADVELAIKLTTDMIKALYKGAKMTLIIVVVRIQGKAVRIVGLLLEDQKDDPAFVHQPQTDATEVKLFDSLLRKERLWINVFDELVRPVLDGVMILNETEANHAKQELERTRPHYGGHAVSLLEKAMNLAMRDCRNWRSGKARIEADVWQPIAVELQQLRPVNVASAEAGEFSVTDQDEGGGLEKSVYLLLEANFPGSAHLSPQFLKGSIWREFCDVLVVTTDELFVFQSKVMPVLKRGTEQTNERRTATVLNNVRDALGQLYGSVRKLRLGNKIYTKVGLEIPIHLDSKKAIHGVVLLSTTNLPLPWAVVAKELEAEGTKVSAKFHVLDFIELQQHVAFGKTPAQLSKFLDRRFEVVSGSGNANVMVRFLNHESTPLSSQPIHDDADGYVFTFEMPAAWQGEFGSILKAFLSVLHAEQFTGRCEYYQDSGELEGEVFLWIALGLQWTGEQNRTPDYDWWKMFESKLGPAVESETGLILSPLSEIASLGAIRASQTLAVAMEFDQGKAVKFFDPDDEPSSPGN
jgi:hypothetical protein